MRLKVGDRVDTLELETIAGVPVRIPGGQGLLHLQFRRFAGCPICNLHLRSMARHAQALCDAGLRQVVFFRSDAASMREYQDGLPFDVVADDSGELYRRFGVERSPMSILHPKAWWAVLRGMLARHRWSISAGDGGELGRHLLQPADLLLDPSGKVLAVKYGAHADDQWSVDELLVLAGTHRPPAQDAQLRQVG
jgi:peroxiredoxin